jgi:hypothetical protein
MRTQCGPWQPCWISNQHQKHKSGRGPSSEHFWQVWFNSVQWFQRRRFKCEKLTDGRRTTTDGRRTLSHDKSSHGLWLGELKSGNDMPKSANVKRRIKHIVNRTLWKNFLKVFSSETSKSI